MVLIITDAIKYAKENFYDAIKYIIFCYIEYYQHRYNKVYHTRLYYGTN